MPPRLFIAPGNADPDTRHNWLAAQKEAIAFAPTEAVVPLRFLPGELAFRWQRLPWAALYGVGLFGFAFILLNPANGYLPPAGGSSFALALALFIGFGIASILFWGFFKVRSGRRTQAPG